MRRYTSKDSLEQRVYGEEQYQPGAESTKLLTIGVSSGTTGKTPTLLILNRENVTPKESHLRDKMRAVLRFSNFSQSTLRQATDAFQLARPSRFLSLSTHDIDNPHIADIIRQFEPSEIIATPSLVVRALNRLQLLGAEDALLFLKRHIRTVFINGEKMTDVQHDIVRRMLPSATLSSNYSLTEMPWNFAYTCPVVPDSDTSVLCIARCFNGIVEIFEPNGNGVGEIVVKTRELGYYKTGDAGSIEPQRCRCGSRKKLIVHGRMDYDIVHCAGAVFLVSEIDRVGALLNDYLQDILVDVSEVTEGAGVRGHVHLTAVPAKTFEANPVTEQQLRDAFESQLFVTRTKTLADLVKKDIFKPTVISFADSIPIKNKKVRLRRVYP